MLRKVSATGQIFDGSLSAFLLDPYWSQLQHEDFATYGLGAFAAASTVAGNADAESDVSAVSTAGIISAVDSAPADVPIGTPGTTPVPDAPVVPLGDDLVVFPGMIGPADYIFETYGLTGGKPYDPKAGVTDGGAGLGAAFAAAAATASPVADPKFVPPPPTDTTPTNPRPVADADFLPTNPPPDPTTPGPTIQDFAFLGGTGDGETTAGAADSGASTLEDILGPGPYTLPTAFLLHYYDVLI